jgi:hypothetical protein
MCPFHQRSTMLPEIGNLQKSKSFLVIFSIFALKMNTKRTNILMELLMYIDITIFKKKKKKHLEMMATIYACSKHDLSKFDHVIVDIILKTKILSPFVIFHKC